MSRASRSRGTVTRREFSVITWCGVLRSDHRPLAGPPAAISGRSDQHFFMSPRRVSATTSNTAASGWSSTTWITATASSGGPRPSTCPRAEHPENVKGIAANARTGRVYISTHRRLGAFDLTTGNRIWVREYEGGADRMALSPDGKILYLPSFEGPHWHALDAMSGDVLKKLVLNSGAHNTLYGPDGRHVYLAGLRSPTLSIADPEHTHGRRAASGHSALRSARSRSMRSRRCASSTSTTSSASKSATSRPARCCTRSK